MWTKGLKFEDTITLSFQSVKAVTWHKSNSTKIHSTTPNRPRGNGKIEQANGNIKSIIIKLAMDQPGRSIQEYLDKAVYLYNRLKSPNGYSPYYLTYGTLPRDDPTRPYHSPYQREPTPQEESQWTEGLVQSHAAPMAKSYASSLNAVRDEARVYLQEKKALIRTYGTGDWELRVRQRGNKTEPYYYGPWCVSACRHRNTYILRSPGGIELKNTYNGDSLFPAYTKDGHPVRSLWYASPRELNRDRQQLVDAVEGLEA